MTQTLTRTESTPADPTIRFTANTVTGAQGVDVQFQATTPASAVAQSLAEMLGMPSDVPYGLRDDASSVYLDDKPIGSQIEPGAVLSVTPKAHLGGGRLSMTGGAQRR